MRLRCPEKSLWIPDKVAPPKFYYDLMVSEAGHYTLFITYARKYGKDIDVDKRWKELVDFEGELIKKYGKSESIHG